MGINIVVEYGGRKVYSEIDLKTRDGRSVDSIEFRNYTFPIRLGKNFIVSGLSDIKSPILYLEKGLSFDNSEAPLTGFIDKPAIIQNGFTIENKIRDLLIKLKTELDMGKPHPDIFILMQYLDMNIFETYRLNREIFKDVFHEFLNIKLNSTDKDKKEYIERSGILDKNYEDVNMQDIEFIASCFPLSFGLSCPIDIMNCSFIADPDSLRYERKIKPTYENALMYNILNRLNFAEEIRNTVINNASNILFIIYNNSITPVYNNIFRYCTIPGITII